MHTQILANGFLSLIKLPYLTLLVVPHLTLSPVLLGKGVTERLSGHLAPSQGQATTPVHLMVLWISFLKICGNLSALTLPQILRKM